MSDHVSRLFISTVSRDGVDHERHEAHESCALFFFVSFVYFVVEKLLVTNARFRLCPSQASTTRNLVSDHVSRLFISMVNRDGVDHERHEAHESA